MFYFLREPRTRQALNRVYSKISRKDNPRALSTATYDADRRVIRMFSMPFTLIAYTSGAAKTANVNIYVLASTNLTDHARPTLGFAYANLINETKYYGRISRFTGWRRNIARNINIRTISGFFLKRRLYIFDLFAVAVYYYI